MNEISEKQNKKIYTIDFNNVKSYLDMHLEIKSALEFPEYYGCNWAAFWDCLTEMTFDTLHIEIIGLEVIKSKFGDSADKMLSILKRLKHWCNDSLCDRIHIEIITGGARTSIS